MTKRQIDTFEPWFQCLGTVMVRQQYDQDVELGMTDWHRQNTTFITGQGYFKNIQICCCTRVFFLN